MNRCHYLLELVVIIDHCTIMYTMYNFTMKNYTVQQFMQYGSIRDVLRGGSSISRLGLGDGANPHWGEGEC